MSFTQVIDIETTDTRAVEEHLAAWHAEQRGLAPGYQGYRLLGDESQAGQHIILVEFTSAEEAQRNNDRPETQAWAAKLQELVNGTPRFRNCRTVAAS